MRIVAPLLVLLLAACGDAYNMAGRYAMGDPAKAVEKATSPDKPSALGEMTLGELAEGDKVYTFSATVDMLLELHEDGTFDYFGSLKMGDDEARYQGRWTNETTKVRLAFDPPAATKGEVVRRLWCRFEPGLLGYPMGRDAKTPVYYQLRRIP